MIVERTFWTLWVLCFVVWLIVEMAPPRGDDEFMRHLKETHGSTAECLERLLRREQEMRTPPPYR